MSPTGSPQGTLDSAPLAGAPAGPPSAPLPVGVRWRLRLLGGFELHDGERSITRLPSRAVTLLLARLALAAGRDHAREELVDLLWPAVPLDVGRNRLRQALSVLRSVLEPASTHGAPVLLADRRTLRLVPGSTACDVDAFESALRRGDTAAAAQWYAGELLPGFYDDWVIDERLRLAALADALQHAPAPHPRALHLPALQLAAVHVPAAPVPASASARAPHPATPGAVPAPMQPVPVAPLAASQPRLPVYLTRLLGFESAGAALAAAVQQQRLVVLRGPGGGGKTRLAVEVARALSQPAAWRGAPGEPFDIIAFVPLAACVERAAFHDAVLLAVQRDASAALAAVAAGDAAARLDRALAGRHALLVLDNFEQLADAAQQDLAVWLAHLPGLHLLVTSRRTLGLDGAFEQALAALPLPARDAPLHTQALNPAVALFVDRARAVRADFHLGERNRMLVADIVQQLQGLPLALELAAARVRSMSLADMLAMLRSAAGSEPGRGLALLSRSGPRAADDARHASMLRVVDWSWQHLDSGSRRRLTLLAAFDDGATLLALHGIEVEALAATDANIPTPSLASTAVGLDDLVAASVAFVREGAAGAGRYHAFEPVREYALSLLGAAQRAALRRQHLQAMLRWASGLGHAPVLDAFRDELPNLLAAMATAEACGEPLLAVQLAVDAAAALADVALPPSGLDTLRRALAACDAACSLAADGHALLAHWSFDAGQRDAAQLHAAQALQLATARSAAHARALYAAARVALRVLNDTARAADLAAQALALARQHGLLHVQAQALVLQAVLAVRVEHDMPRDAALKHEALALWQQLGDPARVAAAQVGLAISMGFARRFADQLQLLEQASQAAAANGQRTLWAFAQSVQGYVLADLGRWQASAGAYLGCLRTAWDIAAWREWFYALWNLPRTLAHSRRPEQAGLLMGFADAFYAQRFGTLGWEDARERRRTRRLVRVQLDPAREAALWRAGALLTMAQSMELACAEAQRLASPAPKPTP